MDNKKGRRQTCTERSRSKAEGRLVLSGAEVREEEEIKLLPSALDPLPSSGFTIDDSHLKGNIFSNLNASTDKGKNLSRNSPGYEQSKAQVQRKIEAMRKRLHPQEPQM